VLAGDLGPGGGNVGVGRRGDSRGHFGVGGGGVLKARDGRGVVQTRGVAVSG
jgi:hypothetical protein